MVSLTLNELLELIKKEGVFSSKTLARKTSLPQSKIEDMLFILQANGYLTTQETSFCQSCNAKGYCSPRDKIRCIKTMGIRLKVLK